MKKYALGAAIAALSIGAVVPAVAAQGGEGAPNRGRPSAEGKACVKAGKEFLKENRLIRDAARRRINWALLDPTGPGIPELGLETGSIRIELGDERYIPLGRLLAMHRLQPGTFAWCDPADPTDPPATTTTTVPDDGSGDV